MGLFDLFSNQDAEQAAQQRNAGLVAGYGQLADLYGQGRNAITAGYGTAGDLYKSLITKYAPQASIYGDAVGANGQAGYDRAASNFRADPGYQFALDQGLQALQRTHAAAGNIASGNADTDTLKYATGLADQTYGNYVSRLSPYLTADVNASNYGTSGAASAAAGAGTGLNTSFQNQGNAANTTQSGIGQSNAAATLNNYNVASNDFNGILGAGKLAANLSGKLAANLFGAFG